MPNIKSAIKRVKITEKKNLRNRMVRTSLKTNVKKLDAAIAAGGADVMKQLSHAGSALDRAASKGIIHKNAANRKKARLARRVAKAQSAQ